MKKIYTLLATILLTMSLINVNAETLNIGHTNYYFYRMSDVKDYSGPLKQYIFNGRVGYCIEPGQVEGTTYDLGNLDVYGFTETQKNNIKLYAYYGYSYPGHRTMEYYAAAQSLIWKEVLGPSTRVIFSSELMGKGTIYDFSSYEEKIKALASKHNVKPSFINKTFEGSIGENIEITDTNNVLNNYELVNSDATINNNTVKIKINHADKKEIKLKRKYYYGFPYRVLNNPSYQDILVEGDLEDEYISLFVKGDYNDIKVTKKDQENNNNLSNSVYELYDINDHLITTLTTNEKGEAFFSKIPGYGKYYLLEKTAPEGYNVDFDKHYFEINDNKVKEIVLYDSKIKVKIDNEIPLNPETFDVSNYYKYIFNSLLFLLVILTFLYIFNKIREE